MVKKERKELIENFFALKIVDLDSRLFSGLDSTASGSLMLTVGGEELSVAYELLAGILYVQFNSGEQGIEIVKIPSFRGFKTLFVCECGKRRNALYLQAEKFQCRVCCDLVYLSTRICKDTANGKIFSDFSKLTKILERREGMSNIWYRGQPTKKFVKLLDDAQRYGFVSFAEEQRAGIEEIKMMANAVNMAKNGHIGV